MDMLGYLRVSTPAQTDGHGFAAQRAAIGNYAYPRRWQVGWITDTGSGGSLHRPGITEALRLLETKQADGLIVARLDRLSRSVRDFVGLIEIARKQRWTLVCIDPGVDLSTPTGQLAATILISVAQWERRVLSERLKEVFAAGKAQGKTYGKPIRTPIEAAQRIHADVAAGYTYTRIAQRLTRDHVPTALGRGIWHKNQVKMVASRPIQAPEAPPLPAVFTTGLERLTPRERQLIAMAKANTSIESIAIRLGVTKYRAYAIAQNAKDKLGIVERGLGPLKRLDLAHG